MRETNTREQPDTASVDRETVKVLRALVRRHRVCWEVLPEQLPVEGHKPLQVGYDLTLYGAHAHGARAMAGCEKCVQIYKGLRKIAQWITPKVRRDSRYETDMFDSAIRYDPTRGYRPEVRLAIRILHRGPYANPVDDCEKLCLSEMKAKLTELGSQEKRWRA